MKFYDVIALVSVKVEVSILEVNKSSPLCEKQTAPAANNFDIQILFYGRLLQEVVSALSKELLLDDPWKKHDKAKFFHFSEEQDHEYAQAQNTSQKNSLCVS